MKITVVGTGYVGLVTGTCLAEVGNHVLCIDTDADKIVNLQRGILPIYEPGLESMVLENSQARRLTFSTDISRGVEFGDILFIAVGTPADEDGSADLQYILQVAKSIGEHISSPKVVVDKSTVPVGTARKVAAAISEELKRRGNAVTFSVVSNPEFLKEGAAVDDFMKPDRIVIGVQDKLAEEKMRELYAPFSRNHEKLIVMDVASAELTKYAANAMLATKISFMNEMSNLAEKLGADIESVRQGIGSDPRIGYQFIYPGCGYGGSCFPKDVKALIKTAADVGYPSSILTAVEEVNDRQKQVLVDKLFKYFPEGVADKKIAVWGLSFKPNTDDMREAPSRVLMEAVWQGGGKISAFDPVATDETARIYGERPDLELEAEDPYAVLEDADALVIITEWKVFRSPDFSKIRTLLKGNVIFDGRNIYNPKLLGEEGFVYFGIGRQSQDLAGG